MSLIGWPMFLDFAFPFHALYSLLPHLHNSIYIVRPIEILYHPIIFIYFYALLQPPLQLKDILYSLSFFHSFLGKNHTLIYNNTFSHDLFLPNNLKYLILYWTESLKLSSNSPLSIRLKVRTFTSRKASWNPKYFAFNLVSYYCCRF